MKAIAQNAVTKTLAKSVEQKHLTAYHNWNVTTNPAGSVSKISAIVQGHTDQQRIGDEVNLVSASIRLHCRLDTPGTTGDYFANVRVLVFQWKMSDVSGPPTLDDILQGTGTNPFVAPYDFDNQRANMFSVLYDKVFLLAAPTYSNTATGSGNQYLWPGNTRNTDFYDNVELDLKFCKKQIQFDAGSLLGVNHIYAAAISDSSVPAHPVVDWYSRLVFTDP